MRIIIPGLLGLMLAGQINAATTVFWTNALTKKYKLSDTPGPDLPSTVVVDEGRVVAGMFSQINGNQYPEFLLGNGSSTEPRGWCAWTYIQNLKSYKGTITSATLRAEYWDWNNGDYSRCQAGAIHIRQGVVNFNDVIEGYGSEDQVIGVWQNVLNPISPTMGYDMNTPELGAEETTTVETPAGRSNQVDESVLAGQFFEMNVTRQIQWILNRNSTCPDSQYAIVFLVKMDTSLGGPGMRAGYSCIDGSYATTQTGKLDAAAWTKDGNTLHLVVEGDLTGIGVEEDVEKERRESALSAFPNPFNPATEISYSTGGQKARLCIFNSEGKTLSSASVAGKGAFQWEAAGFPSGVYFIRLSIGRRMMSRRLVLIR